MIVGLAGVVISLAALPFSSVRMTRERMLLALALLLLHMGATIGYYLYAQSNPADAATYYFDRHNMGQRPLALGTVFTVHFTQFLKNVWGGSYFECFLFFQSIGFWGIMILMRTFQEIHIKMKVSSSVLPYYILFLPGLHFWTAAIGKDAPVFFAASVCVWCVMELRKRFLLFALSLLVMVLFRAHVALIAVTALAAAASLHPRLSLGGRAGLLSLSFIGVAILAVAVETTLQVDVTDPFAVASYLQSSEGIGSGSDLREASFPVRLVSLLFRPFFFDAPGAMGLVASVENVGSLMLFVYFVKNWRSARHLAKQVFFIQFCIIFSIVLIALLTLVYYNVGLGLRQRVMVFPALFSVFVALWVMPRRRAKSTVRKMSGEVLPKHKNPQPLTGISR